VTSNVTAHRVKARRLGLKLPKSRWDDEQVRSAARALDRVLAIHPPAAISTVRDFAGLCRLELLPCHTWGAMASPEDNSFIDQVAPLCGDDPATDERLQHFGDDVRLNPRGPLLQMDDDGRVIGEQPLPARW
jgi:hypothetical protein